MQSRLILGMVFLASTLFASGVGHAERFVSGHWLGTSHSDKSGKFSLCAMNATYKSGISLQFLITRDFTWGIQLINPSWNLRKGARSEVSLHIDDRIPLLATGIVTSKSAITIGLTGIKNSVRNLRRGHVLDIKTNSGTVSFNLTGTFEGISRLSKCVTRQLLAENRASGSNPFASLQSKSKNQNADRIDRAAATVFVTNLLSEAGVTGFKILTPEQHVLTGQDVMWTQPNGLVGAFTVIKDAKDISVDDAVAFVMGVESKNCEGNFASGKKQSANQKGAISVRRLFTACQSQDGNIENHHTLIKTSSGMIMRLLFASEGSGASDELEKSDEAFLQKVDWTSLR